MITSTYRVVGMTCGHCVDAVSTEMAKLAGVTGVEVDLNSGAVKVTSTGPLAAADVVAAVDEAGYELAAGGTGAP
ncbi:MAG: heavy-metal-associated domain-containing protein [Candidatus Dormibacteraeota bacterium]|uniref:Heavy-metal-associated domain-containing protein n=1 Tax=Candidatus Amunia macphersoniae TaxID=3127014 RepID=A0A934NEV9_9BACT|nr:heavy-metal-associated domain-containing protein [Candidatus Dormibacteraeota bacterium]